MATKKMQTDTMQVTATRAMEAPAQKHPRKTRFQGIEEIASGTYRIRVRVWNGRTRRMDEIDRQRRCTEKEAAVFQVDWRRELEAAVTKPNARQLVGDFASKWLLGKLNVLLQSTIDHYTAALEDHILPGLGHFVLGELSHDDIVEWRDAKKAAGYAAASVNGFLRLTKTILRDAAAQLQIGDPSVRVQALPEDDTRITDEEPNSLTLDEAKAFVEAARERWPQHFAMILTLLATGARMSQVCALRWEDIDEEQKEIRFRRRRYKKEVFPGVKGRTAAARKRVHVVSLTDEHAEVLRDHRKALVAEQHRGLSAAWVFPSATGELHGGSVLCKPFKDILAHLKITKRFTPHGLRRTCNDVTRQVASAVVTKSITGHMTDQLHEHYSTVGLGEKHAAMEKVVRLILGPAGGGSGGGSSG